MNFVQSKDGTSIAYTREGSGPAVILVGGGLDDGAENTALANVLSRQFTVYNYARRGRGESGDTQPYALKREIEDIEALIAEADEPVYLFGASSGGALVLEAAAAGLPVSKLAVYEVPFSIDDEAVQAWEDYVKKLHVALSEDKREEALELFMLLAGASEESIIQMKDSPYWPPLMTLAPTLAYDAAVLGNGQPPAERLQEITQPTLVATGGGHDPNMQGLQPNFFGFAADAIATLIPGAVRQTIESEGHIANPEILGSMLERFFNN